jgi:hypothetical protein
MRAAARQCGAQFGLIFNFSVPNAPSTLWSNRMSSILAFQEKIWAATMSFSAAPVTFVAFP